MSELKTGLAGVATGEKPKASIQIYDEESSEEMIGVRARRSATQKKRAYVDDEDEEFNEEELKGCLESESAGSYLDESSDSYVKKKKAPAKKAPPQSAPPQKRQQSISELKKRPSELTQQPEAEQSLYVDKEDEFIGGGFASLDEIKEARPSFIKEEYMKDLQGKRIDDPDYDPTTLFIPKDEWKGFTPAMHQYWQIKQHNFDKILFFKLGKFYEIFYNDAIICQKLLDLNWMGGAKKLHVGFPEKALDKYLVILVEYGYKVAVIEQTETPKQLE